MKRKLFLLIFSLLFGAGLIAWRIWILGNCVENFNGFFLPEYEYMRILFAVVMVVFIAIVCILTYTDKRYPCSPRRSSKALAILNLCYGIVSLVEAFTLLYRTDDVFDYIYLLSLVVLSAFMFYYALYLFIFKKVNSLISAVPLVFFVIKLAHNFIESFSVIKTSEVALMIIALIFCVVFFQFYARYISKLNFRKIRKITLASGVCASVFSALAVLPDMVVPFLYTDVNSRIAGNESIFMLATSIYIMAFLIISFSKKLLYNIHIQDGEEYTSDPFYE